MKLRRILVLFFIIGLFFTFKSESVFGRPNGGICPPGQHDWTNWTITKEATCSEKEEQKRTCQACFVEDYRTVGSVNKNNHPASELYVIANECEGATCTKKGKTVYKCYACGGRKTTFTDALGHDYKNTVTNPTCTRRGWTTHTCSRCGDSYTDSYTNQLAHNYKNTVIAPTCTTGGSTTHTCSNCGYSYTDLYTNASGHNYQVTSNTPATCGKSGQKIETCSKCNDTKTTTLNATGQHQFVNGVCKVCGKTKTNSDSGTDVHVHVWDDATCTEPKTCSTCGETSGNALGHQFVSGVCKRCGIKENVPQPVDEWIVLSEENDIKAKVVENNTLEIVGNGRIPDFESAEVNPLNPLKYTFNKVHIKGELTNLPAWFMFYFTNIKEVTIDHPETIEEIGYGAFFGCKNLKHFDMPTNVKSIGAFAFCHCHKLQEIDLSGCTKLKRIANSTFRDCWLLKHVEFPEGLKVIGYEAFLNDISLTEVILPSTIVAIGTKGLDDNEEGLGLENQLTAEEKENANTRGYNNVFTIDFARNSGSEHESYINYVLQSNSYESLTDLINTVRVFYYPTNELLTSYVGQKVDTEMLISPFSWDISNSGNNSIIASLSEDGVLTITGQGKIKNFELFKSPWYSLNDKIREIHIGEGITELGNHLFYDCSMCESVTLPSTLTRIGTAVFYNCKNLASITLPNGLTTIEGHTFTNCEKITEITLPAGISVLPEGVFGNCYRLAKVEIKGDVIQYGNRAFFNCPSLNTYTISPYVKQMGDEIFRVDDNKGMEVKGIKYYVVSEVALDYIYNNDERNFVSENINELAIKTNPTKTEYYDKDDINTAGLVLTASYYNGTTNSNKKTKDVTNGFDYSPKKANTAGTQEITVSYGGKEAKYNIEVTGLKVESLGIGQLPTKLEYNKGEQLNTEGLQLIATYNNNEQKTVTEGYKCFQNTLNVAGTQGIIVSYQDCFAKFSVFVASDVVQSIDVEELPNKFEYNIGETLDTAGLKILVTHEDKSTEVITEGFTCYPTTLTKEGEKTITVRYQEKATTFRVIVKKPEENKELEVTSVEYNIEDDTISDIQPDETLRTIIGDITTNASDVRIFKGETEVNSREKMATGMVIKFKKGEQEKDLTVSIKGDVTGDGEIDFKDIVSMNKHRLGKTKLRGVYETAGKVTNEENITFKDIVRINKYRLGKISEL